MTASELTTASRAPGTASTDPPTLRVGRAVRIPIGLRSVIVAGALLALIVAVVLATLAAGDQGVSVLKLLTSGTSELSAPNAFVLERLRGPRVSVALTAGAGLALSGALFQTVTRNPLGSPDVMGLSAGAGAGAAAVGLMWTGFLPLPAGALMGAGIAMLLVYLGTGHGFRSPARMIIVGIGVNAMAMAFTQWVITRTHRDQATIIAAYINGSTASRSWGDVIFMVSALTLVTGMALALSPRLRLLEMGDELADALGAQTTRTRTLAMLVAIASASAAVTVVGPVAFVALTAPQIGRRLTRAPGPNLAVSTLTGALLLALADLATQHGPVAQQLPVGILTAGLGGIYLGYLLLREWRRVSV